MIFICQWKILIIWWGFLVDCMAPRIALVPIFRVFFWTFLYHLKRIQIQIQWWWIWFLFTISKNMNNTSKNELSSEQQSELLSVLSARFDKNMKRHTGMEWSLVQSRLEANTEKLWSLSEMERTGGEPDVVRYDTETHEYVLYDCSSESPTGRRSLCYDRVAWESRRENKPANNAMDMAASMGIEMLTEEQYRGLQTLGEYDTKTSSWLLAPREIRELGGAIFGDRRYNRVFVYHNGAESYYAGRAFRGSVRV